MKDTALAQTFRRLIRATGPISLAHFMAEGNARYYAGAHVLGKQGDFITAPDISQVFGEMCGLWLADMWHRAGAPPRAHYVELGPGRAALASDALRAMKTVALEPSVHFVETSAELRRLQARAVPDAHFHADLSRLPEDGPILLVANEFLDALPVRQLVKTDQGWREVLISCDEEGRLIEVPGTLAMDSAVPPAFEAAREGAILETSPASAAVVQEVSRRLSRQGGAALLIDYGHRATRLGSSIQAVQDHTQVDWRAAPGEADISAHVDFGAMADVARQAKAQVLGISDQGAFLLALGADQRFASLAKSAPHRAIELRESRDRLVAREHMGALFKVLGLAGKAWPKGQGF